MAYEGKPLPSRNEVDRTGSVEPPENISASMPTIAEQAQTLPRLPRRPNGFFRHPDTWTEQEVAVIVDGLKMNMPIMSIAKLVHCERHTLSKFIHSQPELLRLKEEQSENLYEEAVYQADRLAKAGNASIVMFILERLGKDKGWSQNESAAEGGVDEGRIVMGVIPDEEVERAEEAVKSKQETDGLGKAAGAQPPKTESPLSIATDPVKLAAYEEDVKAMAEARAAEIVREKMAAMEREAEGDGGRPPYAEGRDDGGFGGGDYDPYSSGADSMFMQ